MPIYTGKSSDGSDARLIKGMYVSRCGNKWSTKPITQEQKAYDKVYDHCAKYGKSFRDLYNQVKAGSRENLPKYARNYLIEMIEDYDSKEQ